MLVRWFVEEASAGGTRCRSANPTGGKTAILSQTSPARARTAARRNSRPAPSSRLLHTSRSLSRRIAQARSELRRLRPPACAIRLPRARRRSITGVLGAPLARGGDLVTLRDADMPRASTGHASARRARIATAPRAALAAGRDVDARAVRAARVAVRAPVAPAHGRVVHRARLGTRPAHATLIGRAAHRPVREVAEVRRRTLCRAARPAHRAGRGRWLDDRSAASGRALRRRRRLGLGAVTDDARRDHQQRDQVEDSHHGLT